ncbi:MAG: ribulokinase [Alistipes sp.]|nr:ribulokinase [Candidatus Alistipes equi]
MDKAYVIGLDFGTDSARAILVNAITGEEIAEKVNYYPRWANGLYCDASKKQFRQHPLDYIESLHVVLHGVLDAHSECRPYLKAIALDTTASTPCLADRNLTPLALRDEFKDNPDAMFVLWKDHTAEKEAEEIERACHKSQDDYTKVAGFKYSAECYWSKVMHLLRESEELSKAAYTIVEECDWIPALLTGNTDPEKAKIGHCGAAQKMFWNEEWGGFPPRKFFTDMEPKLGPVLDTMRAQKYTCDKAYGTISRQWAEELDIPLQTIVGTGNVDSHQGAIGAGITYRTAVINLGTSACCMAVVPPKEMGNRIVEGVFGQADSIILPAMVGFEIGLSAFGDVFAWFKRILSYTTQNILASIENIEPETKQRIILETEDKIMQQLTMDAEKLPIREDAPFATDWLNGRRSPDCNPYLWGSLMGLRLATTAPELYYALVESTAFALKRVVDTLDGGKVAIDKIIGVGGIAQKSPFVMQMLADVIGKDLHVSACKQSCALGSAICAAVVGRIYPTIQEAQKSMCMPIIKVYHPRKELKEHFAKRFQQYMECDSFTKKML